MSAYDKHKRLIKSYLQHKGSAAVAAGGGLSAPETDMDILARHNQFIRDEDADAKSSSWEVSLNQLPLAAIATNSNTKPKIFSTP